MAQTIMRDGASLGLLDPVDMIDGNFESAMEYAKRSLEADSSATTSMVMEGQVHIIWGKTEERVELTRPYMGLQPKYDAFDALGLCLGSLILGDHEEAKEISSGYFQTMNFLSATWTLCVRSGCRSSDLFQSFDDFLLCELRFPARSLPFRPLQTGGLL